MRISDWSSDVCSSDLCDCLIAMGAEIEGVGSEHITVHGKPSLQGAKHQIVPDRIETGTYAAAVAICGGRVELTGTRLDLIESVEIGSASCRERVCQYV